VLIRSFCYFYETCRETHFGYCNLLYCKFISIYSSIKTKGNGDAKDKQIEQNKMKSRPNGRAHGASHSAKMSVCDAFKLKLFKQPSNNSHL